MKQHEAVIKILEDKGGFATLGELYQMVDFTNWKTKTPFATIRRIVQNDRLFFKIKPGLWALNSHKNYVIKTLNIEKQKNQKFNQEFNHSYYQGLLVEIGNLEGYKTFVPYQDKNKKYLAKPLQDLVTIKEFYPFTYNNVIRRAITIDVSWFNERKFPSSFFEIEHSTDIHNSLLKFLELQDFNVNFNIVADKVREKEFIDKMNSVAFYPIRNKVKFIDYEKLAAYHSKLYEIATFRNEIVL
ncbi:MAG: hypothetical protein WAR79_03885 [Melioribacteraceae bacterium]